MNFTLIIILMISISVLNIVCFFIGAMIGQKVINKEQLEIPELNPINRHKEKERKEVMQEYVNKQEQEFFKNLRNIDNYNGSSFGQENF